MVQPSTLIKSLVGSLPSLPCPILDIGAISETNTLVKYTFRGCGTEWTSPKGMKVLSLIFLKTHITFLPAEWDSLVEHFKSSHLLLVCEKSGISLHKCHQDIYVSWQIVGDSHLGAEGANPIGFLSLRCCVCWHCGGSALSFQSIHCVFFVHSLDRQFWLLLEVLDKPVEIFWDRLEKMRLMSDSK